ncbi:hypothetical protein BDV11DRAFT_171012 [Aspergillus similis]
MLNQLPEYDLSQNGCVILNYGEVFSLVSECFKATNKFCTNSNLHSLTKSHEGMKLEGNTGARVAQKIVNKAVFNS